MASVIRDSKTGLRRIEFYDTNGARRRVRLGRVSQKQAEAVRGRIEQLLAAKATGHATGLDTLHWLTQLSPALRRRIARAGLIDDHGDAACLDAFIAGYIAARPRAKPRTVSVWQRSRAVLVAHFGAGKPLQSITRGDAADWRRWLQVSGRWDGGPLAANTVANHVKRAKGFFRYAVDRRLIHENPFAGLPSSIGSNATRSRFITPADAAAVLAACPDPEWSLIFALSRYGGLRCPSEHLRLKWADIDWQAGRMTVTAPKTEHHEGKGTRAVPIFPQLLPHLQAVHAEAPEGAEWVIMRYRQSNSNLRTQLERIIRRAGLQPWPKLFHNLRASRQTELEESFPSHVVCAWIGNSERVARLHYLQVTDDHFDRATKSGAKSGAVDSGKTRKTTAQRGKKAGETRGAVEKPAEKASSKVRPEGVERTRKRRVKRR